jgi:hypothetical protein
MKKKDSAHHVTCWDCRRSMSQLSLLAHKCPTLPWKFADLFEPQSPNERYRRGFARTFGTGTRR